MSSRRESTGSSRRAEFSPAADLHDVTLSDAGSSRAVSSPESVTYNNPIAEEHNEICPASPDGRKYHVDDALTHVGFGRFQWFMLFYTGVAWAGDAMEMMLLSFLGPFVKCEWGLSPSQESMLTTFVFLGMLIGVNLFGYVSDACGRKIGFFATAVFSAFMGVGSAVAPTYAALVFFRAMVGIGLGGVPVAMTLFMEFMPSANRGKWLVIIESFWTVGTFFEAGIAWLVLPTLGWRWLLGISAIPQVLLVLLYPLLPESPYWLASKGRGGDATKVLARVARVNGGALPPGTLEVTAAPTLPSRSSSGGGNTKPRGKCGFFQPLCGMCTSLGALYTKDLRRTTLMLHFIWAACSVGYYGLVILTTELHLEGGRSCVDGAPTFDSSDYLNIFITTLAEVPGLILAELTVERLGRRKSMGSTMLLGGASAVFLTFGLSMNAETVFLFLSRCFVLSAFTVIYIYTPEVYPTTSRSLGLGINNAFARMAGMVAPFIAVNLPEAGMEVLAELLLAGLVTLGGAASFLLPFETAGKELTETVQKPGLLEMAELPTNHAELFEAGTPPGRGSASPAGGSPEEAGTRHSGAGKGDKAGEHVVGMEVHT
eukprot:jgi/Tetstr1/436999/TSEL_002738.t1